MVGVQIKIKNGERKIIKLQTENKIKHKNLQRKYFIGKTSRTNEKKNFTMENGSIQIL